ncbi:Methyl-accepting chemotaxis protein [Peptoclostridium litorale DSM 5388]|uniref:Methyl-accepting chemotaxis protein TlpA n=1 Tax=Peptoclostridium litorale DSM 5388 TaxID=1121324 RepID=A0A069RD76_PEPLI|nr:methyl-accepting chemotaxis protein [Peptoclostridium litorale]KDR94713.1 methyl-accepting chemotaxis protein TlpA [Peptoclostridium litorale DSM 5388]SIO32982.1 Methyl-accepting chemotaxis protein [Peptoclostridium litorale DSM 5388]
MTKNQKRTSVKWTLVFISIAILIAGVSAVLISCLDSAYDKMTFQMKQNGNSIAGQASKRISESVASYDESSVLKFQNIIDELGNEEGIVYALVIDKNLNAIAHSEHDRIGISLDDEGSKTAALNGKNYSSTFDYEKTSETVYDVLMPLSIGGEHFGALNIGLSMESLKKSRTEMIINSSILCMVLILISSAVLYLLISRILRPLTQLMDSSAKVASGDLTEEIKTSKSDEIGMVSMSFNSMTQNLKSIVENISSVCIETQEHCSEILASSQEVSAASEQIAAATQGVASGTEEQTKSTAQALSSLQEITDSIGEFKQEVEYVINNADDTSRLALDGKIKMNDMAKQMDEIKASVDKASSAIQDLNIISVEIGNIIDVMDGISSQTNLLALNAAIEAARAGESGRGFAVVAEEIKKLAEASLSSSENIRHLIQSTQKGTHDALSAIEAGSQEVHTGVTTIEHIESAFESILQSFENTKTSIHSASSHIEFIDQNSHGIISKVENIDQVSQSSAANSEEVAASAEEQSAASEQMSSSIQSLMEMIDSLSTEVRKFKTN